MKRYLWIVGILFIVLGYVQGDLYFRPHQNSIHRRIGARLFCKWGETISAHEGALFNSYSCSGGRDVTDEMDLLIIGSLLVPFAIGFIFSAASLLAILKDWWRRRTLRDGVIVHEAADQEA